MNKDLKEALYKDIETYKEFYDTKDEMVIEMLDGLKQLLDESPNFLHISKSTNPTTNRILECVDKKPAVAILVTTPLMDKGIFVKQYRVGSQDYIWECPAGVVEDNQSPTDAVYAELRQEIGLERKDILYIKKVNELYSSVGWTNEVKHLYIAIVAPKVHLKEQQLDDGEALTYEWKTFADILNDPLNKIMPLSTSYLLNYVDSHRMDIIARLTDINKF